MSEAPVATRSTFVGLFLVALATLMYELLLTRIFSVTMWYHFAFVAVSVAMLGMTVGALAVYLSPNRFPEALAPFHLALGACLFGIAVVASFFIHLAVRIPPDPWGTTYQAQVRLIVTYVVTAVPFALSGGTICIALTRFPRQVGTLYAADLAGAAAGCLALIYALHLTDGPTAVILVAFLASLGSVFFAAAGSARLMQVGLALSVVFLSLAVVNAVQSHRQSPLLRLKWVKGRPESRPLWEKWNSFSRITVFGDPNVEGSASGWGLSPAYPGHRGVKQLGMTIDAAAATTLTGFDGDLARLEHLTYDITNLAHYLRPASTVLVVGTGGGRDILSALAFGQRRVIGVEINEDVIATVNRRFGDFTGHLDKHPRVTFVNDEARSYIARQRAAFDIIQISLIDTWAATAAGAFVFTENSLYTVEAWTIFLQRLATNGILTVSRWYFSDRPGEIYRLTSLASAALHQLGAENPRAHIAIARRMWEPQWGAIGVGTVLVSRAPFSDTDLDRLSATTGRLQFEPVLDPRFALDPTLAALASGHDPASVPPSALNIAPPTDDWPFFFHMVRFRDMFDRRLWEQGLNSLNLRAVNVLGSLLITVLGLTVVCIIVPLVLTTRTGVLEGAPPLFIFFAGIGLGYMFIEISQMQRLIIFLGHPMYGLSVVLFSLLVSSSLGSYSTRAIANSRLTTSGTARLFLLLCALIISGLATPYASRAFQPAPTPLRLLVAAAVLFPPGLFMGMAFPLGMKAAALTPSAPLSAWFWGLNGATSVCASVLAVAIALGSGISTSYWTGVACYAVAFLAFVRARRQLASANGQP